MATPARGSQASASSIATPRRPAVEARIRPLLALMVALELVFLVVRGSFGPRSALAPVLPVTVLGGALALALARPLSRLKLPGLAGNGGGATGGAVALVALLAAATCARLQPAFPPDEEAHLEAARLLAREGAARFFAAYAGLPWLGRQHPPLVPVLSGVAVWVLGPSLLAIRLVSVAFTGATVGLTYRVGAVLYDRTTGFLGALLLLSFPLFVRTGSAAMTDLPVTFFFLLSVFLLLRLTVRPRAGGAVALGLVAGLGLLSKYTMLLAWPVLVAGAALLGTLGRLRWHLGLALLVSLGMLLAWLLQASAIGALGGQWTLMTKYVRLATTTEWGHKWLLDALTTKSFAAVGLYDLPLIALGLVRIAADRFLLSWCALVYVPVLLTLPDNRYVLPAFPAVALIAARGLERRPELRVPALGLAFFLCVMSLWLYQRLEPGAAAFLFREQ